MKSKIFGLLIAAGLLSVISCSQEEWATTTPPETDGEEVTMTFSLSTEGRMVSTRGTSDELSHISDGTKATKLVYAVYTPSEEGYRLLPQYGAAKDDEENGIGEGQVIEDAEDLLSEGGHTITLRLVRGKEYCIAFWAQDPDCDAYDTKDLEKIKVSYKNAKNNEELRDAFSAAITFTAQADKEEKAVLTRVMAQINVGTAGWDYLGEVDYGNRYAYSKIMVKGVYDQLNALTGEVTKEDETKELVATFDWQKLPAYINITEGFPTLPATDITVAQMLEQIKFLKTPKANQTNEEFLFVKLTNENPINGEIDYRGSEIKYLPYLEDIPEKDDNNTSGIYTEVFKYLSMCYVLAPKHTQDNADWFDENGVNGGTTVTVTFYMAEDANGYIYDNPELDEDFKDNDSEYLQKKLTKQVDNKSIFTLTNVPVQGNWRTNILGGTALNGSTPDDDDTSIFNPRSVRCIIDVVPGYQGEHNTTDNGSTWPTWKDSQWEYK